MVDYIVNHSGAEQYGRATARSGARYTHVRGSERKNFQDLSENAM